MFYKESKDFVSNMKAIREFIDLVEPVFIQKRKDHMKNEAKDLSILMLALSDPLLSNIEDGKFQLSEDSKQKIRDNFDGEIVIEKSEDGHGVKVSVNGNGAERFDNAVSMLGEIEKQTSILYKSSLMNIISTVECHFSNLIMSYYKVNTKEITSGLISKKDKHFTLEELESFETLEDAKNHLIESKVENLLRGSFDDWIEFLKDKMKLNLGYLEAEKNNIVEIFQRRNIVVHNQGIINSIYLSKISKEYKKNLKKGEPILIDRVYLEKSIDTLELIFLLIGFELWKNKKPNDQKRFDQISQIIEDCLFDNRWFIMKGLTRFLMGDAKAPQVFKNMSKINNWLAHKKMGEFEVVKKDVEAEDFSSCTMDFIICKLALLGEKDKIFHYIDEAIISKSLTYLDLEEWPIFDDYREEEKFINIISKKDV